MAHAEQGYDIEEGAGPQEIDVWPVSVVVIFGALTTLILIFLTIMFYNYMVNTILETKGLEEPNVKVVSVIADQRKELGSYGVVDAQKGRVAVPIETAMAMIVEERTRNPNPKIAPVVPQGSKPADPKENKDAKAGKAPPVADQKPAANTAPKGAEKQRQEAGKTGGDAKREPAPKGDQRSAKDAPQKDAKGNEKR